MSYQSILSDVWVPNNPDLLDEQTFYIAELIYGHLIHHFSTPASFMTWDENTPRRIRVLLRKVATLYPKVKPSAAIRTMFVVLSVKEAKPNAVAFDNDVELLYMMAFKAIAWIYDRTLTPSVFEFLTDMRYVGTKLEHYPHYLRSLIARAVHKDRVPKNEAKMRACLKYYLSPFMPVGWKRPNASPALPLYVDLERREPAGSKQSLVFPDSQHKLSPLSPIIEEESAGSDYPFVDVDDVLYETVPQAASTSGSGLIDFASSTTLGTDSESSSLSDPFDDDSRTSSSPSASSSLTMMSGSTAAGPAGGSNFVEKPLVQCAAAPASDEDSDMVDAKSLGSSSSTLSATSSEECVRHNPASQLNAVFATRQPQRVTIDNASSSSTVTSADDNHDWDPFPDLNPNFRAQAREWESSPEPFIHATKSSPMKHFRQWQANRRGRKAFASGPNTGLGSSEGPVVSGNHDHDDEARLMTADDFTREWQRPSTSERWKRALLLPVAYAKLRIRGPYYGYE